MRPIAPLAAVSGVRKHTARESEAPNDVRMGKSAWRAPTPNIWPGSRKAPGLYINTDSPLSARRARALCPEPALAPGPAR